MKPHVRACIAYIAARLILARPSTGLFDPSQTRRLLLSGTVERETINVYDHERRCFIRGAGDGAHYTLFHEGEGHHLSLDRQDAVFRGHDYGRSTRFEGRVEGNEVVVHELESDLRFRYVL